MYLEYETQVHMLYIIPMKEEQHYFIDILQIQPLTHS